MGIKSFLHKDGFRYIPSPKTLINFLSLFLFLGMAQNLFAANSQIGKPSYSYCVKLLCYQISGDLAQLDGIGKNKILVENAYVQIFENQNGQREEKQAFYSDNAMIDNQRKVVITEAKTEKEKSIYLNMRTGSLVLLN